MILKICIVIKNNEFLDFINKSEKLLNLKKSIISMDLIEK
ncbi:hypothetical protein CNEO_43191 [Clostridium neonatale]|uniref:Uncharacterized protein n=1 Tax=Clostridium neonatale TaxID=137838 RepID=A0AA86JL42_9CLOT|nr:hypothetical protein CNEO_43191 [Clostridium neonatale]